MAGMPITDQTIERVRLLLITVAVLIVTIGRSPNLTGVSLQAADFGFRFDVGDCLGESLDTFTGMFTKDLGGSPRRSVTAHIVLPRANMTAIHDRIETIHFFDYPSDYSGVPLGTFEATTTNPSSTYRLEVRNSGVVHAVRWKDAYSPTTLEASRLRALLAMIAGFVHDHPAYKRLPHSGMACM
jgi:hypothetical protein